MAVKLNKMTVITHLGRIRILIAVPKEHEWGPGEGEEYYNHHPIETRETAQALHDHFKIVDGKPILLPEEEWAEAVDARMEALNDSIEIVTSGKYTTLEEISIAVDIEQSRLAEVG